MKTLEGFEKNCGKKFQYACGTPVYNALSDIYNVNYTLLLIKLLNYLYPDKSIEIHNAFIGAKLKMKESYLSGIRNRDELERVVCDHLRLKFPYPKSEDLLENFPFNSIKKNKYEFE